MKKRLSFLKLFFRQFPFIFPNGIIYGAQEYITTIQKKTEWYRLRDSHWCKEKFAEEIIINKLPLNFREEHALKFRQNRIIKTYNVNLFFFSGIFLLGDNGIVLSKKNKVFNEFTHNFKISNLQKSKIFTPFFCTSFKITKENRIAALLCSPESNNHYHWLFDALPRLKLLENVIDAIEVFIVPNQISKNQIWMLNQMGITEERLYKITPTEKIWFENIYITSLPGSEGFSPKWAIDFLRKSFGITKNKKKEKNYYFTRRDVKTRQIINEEAIITLLLKHDFEVITMSELSFIEQIEICSNAKTIISYHGAALSNIVFSTDCTIVEIFSPDYFRTDCYYTLANLLNLKYFYLVGENSFDEKRLLWGDIFLEIEKLQQTLTSFLNQQIEN